MRNKTIDAFRGLIMILMALDHASYFLIDTHFYEGYDFITSYPNTLAFITRWVTHLCAPGFFFAMGYGAVHSYNKNKHRLLRRIILLLILQFTLINFAWNNDFIYVGVITSLALSLLLVYAWMPYVKKYGLFIGLILILFSHVIMHTSVVSSENIIVRLLFVPGSIGNFYVLYTLIPLAGLACIGGFFAEKKINYLLLSGISLILFLLFTRDYSSFQSIFTVVKYPASLRFISITMAINFFIMYLLNKRNIVFLEKYGQTALIFYVLHLYVYKLLGNYITSDSYLLLYSLWIISIIVMYPICRKLRKISMQAYALFK